MTTRRAFTLVELIIVLLIIGIMAAVAVPRYLDSLSYFRVDAAAKKTRADLNFAQHQAKLSSASRTVQFALATASYQMPGITHPDHSGSDYEVTLSQAPFQVTMPSANFGGDANIVFDGFGKPDTGGSVTVRSGSFQKTVLVNSDTGEATIQ